MYSLQREHLLYIFNLLTRVEVVQSKNTYFFYCCYGGGGQSGKHGVWVEENQAQWAFTLT